MVRIALIATLITACLASCAQPEFWIPGLYLPHGSHVIGKTTKTNVTNIGGINLAMGNRVEKILMVTFNNSSRWDTVKVHFDSELKGKGFTIDEAIVARILGVSLSGMPSGKRLEHLVVYGNPVTNTVVTLHDMKGVAQGIGGGSSAVDMSSLGVGDYIMRVVKIR